MRFSAQTPRPGKKPDGQPCAGPVTALARAKLVFTAAASAAIAFAFAVSTGSDATATAASAAGVLPTASRPLAETNRRLASEVERVAADLRALQTENARLRAESAARVAIRADGLMGDPLPRHEIQESILKNLKKIRTARDQFQMEHGRAPASLGEIVGGNGYFKRLVTVDGEDYASLSLEPGRVLAVTSLSGITVKYGDGTGDDATTQVDYPPKIARVKAIVAALKPAAQAAFEAYRLANQGKSPEDTNALLPFFATPQDRALYLEYLEANRAAKQH